MGDKSTDLAQQRTDWAEDRTLLANERTFAGWMRTGLACVGMGVALHAIFGKFEPTWLARSAATIFVVIGCLIFATAWRRSCAVMNRINDHAAEPASNGNMTIVAGLLVTASVVTTLILWLL